MPGPAASAVAFYRFAPGLPTTAAPAPTSDPARAAALARASRSLTVEFPHAVRRTHRPEATKHGRTADRRQAAFRSGHHRAGHPADRHTGL